MANHSAPEGKPATTDPQAARLDVNQLIAEHHAAVYRYAYRLAGAMAEAEDLTQQVFLVAQQRLHQIREVEKARAWLYAVLRSVYLKSRRKPVPLPAGTLELDMDTLAGPAVPAEGFDREKLQAALGELHDDFKVVVLMFYFEDLSYKEIAEQLSLPIGTVMSRLSRAKGRLRELLSEPPSSDGPRVASRQPQILQLPATQPTF